MAAAMLREKYPDVCLLLTGNGDSVDPATSREAFKYEAASLIERLGLEDSVRFIDARGDEMPLYMNSADVVVYPTILPQGEAFGIAPVEAMACGRPVIVTASGGLVESIRHGINGLVIERDPDTLAGRLSRCIGLLLGSPELAEYLGKNGREIAVERFDSRKMALKMERLYRMLAGGRATRNGVRVDAGAARPIS